MRAVPVLRIEAALVLATLAAMLPLSLITEDRAYLLDAAALCALLAVVSAGLRLIGVRSLMVPLCQVLVLAGVMGAGARAVRDTTGHPMGVVRVVMSGITQMGSEAAPIHASAPSRWLLVLFVGLVLVVTDLLVTTLAAPAWSLAPLATLYLIPALAAPVDVPWWMFAALGVGYLAVLAADAANGRRAWTRNIEADSNSPRRLAAGSAWPTGLVVAAGTVTAAAVLAAAVPLPRTMRPVGQAKSASSVQMNDPTINLAHNLNQPANVPVLTYTTSTGEGVYLRMAALTVVSASGWSFPASGVSLRDGRVPAAPGAGLGQKTISGSVQVGNFSSEYLPVPYAVQGYSAAGVWRWNAPTMMVVSTAVTGRLQATRQLDYTFTASQVEPDATAFATASAGRPTQDAATVTQVPSDVPKVIIDLAREITRGARSDAEKAARIQAYLADPTRFHYDTTAPAGDGYEVLVDFLTRSHRGYCIHFASAMALMARIVGIPARVASGFLPGHRVGDHWQVDSHDMHAWPELYFQGYGWVRFEPTTAVSAAPAWTRVSSPTASTTPSASRSASRRPSSTAGTATASTAPRATTVPRPSSTASAPAPTTTSGGARWGHVLGLAGGGALVLLLLAAPALTRRGLRRRRLGVHGRAQDAVEDAWAETRAVVVDAGMRWPTGSPRAIAARLASVLGGGLAVGESGAHGSGAHGSDCDVGAPEGLADDALGTVGGALGHLSGWVERSRYARDLGAVPDDLAAHLARDVAVVRAAAMAPLPWQRRVGAILLPRSLWHRRVG